MDTGAEGMAGQAAEAAAVGRCRLAGNGQAGEMRKQEEPVATEDETRPERFDVAVIGALAGMAAPWLPPVPPASMVLLDEQAAWRADLSLDREGGRAGDRTVQLLVPTTPAVPIWYAASAGRRLYTGRAAPFSTCRPKAG
ncbi:MAG: hypothetical protein R3D03_07800 [Geminicoccaceae bacterium]